MSRVDGVIRRCRRYEGARFGALVRLTAPLLLVAAVAGASNVEVALDDTKGSCRVRGTFVAPVSGAVAWNVLADYDSIGRFVPSVRASHLERRADGQLLLRQDAVSSMFLVRRRVQVLLEIDEDRGRRIGFRDVLGKDFRSYVGEWRIESSVAGTQVHYVLEAVPRGALMRAFCRGVLRHTAQDLLEQVRAEMMRRAAEGS